MSSSGHGGKFVLAGAGGFGREVQAWLGMYSPRRPCAGFVDDVSTAGDVLGPIATHAVVPDADYITCFGKGADRCRVGQLLLDRGARIGSVVSPAGSYVSPVDRSLGSILLGVCSVSCNVQLGNFCLIQGFACIGHDVTLGDGVTVSSHAFIGGGASIGAFTTIHPHATILPKVKVGRHVVVGAGAVVLKDVPDGVTVFGNPAKVIAIATPAG